MAAMERIAQMNERMRKCLNDKELLAECILIGRPASMRVTFHDGPGVQFFDESGKPILPDFIRDEELAITLWNALTDQAPIDLAWFA
jgi:hypothetical protein